MYVNRVLEVMKQCPFTSKVGIYIETSAEGYTKSLISIELQWLYNITRQYLVITELEQALICKYV